jgi:branched-chain amino acid transport system permease protein
MRFIFKTKYEQDINIAKHNGDRVSYGLLVIAMILIPFFYR